MTKEPPYTATIFFRDRTAEVAFPIHKWDFRDGAVEIHTGGAYGTDPATGKPAFFPDETRLFPLDRISYISVTKREAE